MYPTAPREVHGCSQFWQRAGSELPLFGMWPLGPRPADSGAWGHTEGSMRHKGIRHKTGSAHAPRGRQCIRPSRPYRWLSLGTFAELVLGARGGYLHPRGQNNDFPCSGRTRGVWPGLESCGPGPPNGPFRWPYSQFGRARYLNSDIPLGLWGCSTTAKGQHLGCQG